MYCTYAVLCARVYSHPPPPTPFHTKMGGGIKKQDKKNMDTSLS